MTAPGASARHSSMVLLPHLKVTGLGVPRNAKADEAGLLLAKK